MKFIKYYILITFIYISLGFEFSSSKSNVLLNEIKIKNCFSELINSCNDNIKILNSKNMNNKLFFDIFDIYCKNENIEYDIINYNSFFKNDYKKNNNLILVNDFMIDYGRTLTQYEKETIKNINELNDNFKYILYIENYDNLVLKDDEFINKFKIIEYPQIDIQLLNNYIINMIQYYNYNNDLLLIDWKKYDIDKLNVREIENLMFNIHILMTLSEKNNKNYNIDYYHKILERKFNKINRKYYDK